MSAFESVADTGAIVEYKFGGAREMVSLDRAKELVAGIVGSGFTHIDLSNKSYADDAAAYIGEDLAKRCKGVKVAHLADMIAGRMEEEALRTLKSICDGLAECALEELNLDDNAMGKPGIIACEAALKCKSLKRLYLCNDGLSGEAGEQLYEILSKDGMPPLEVFQFYNNMAGNPGAVSVSKIVALCPNLTEFRFSGTRSQAEGCDEVARELYALGEMGVRLTKLDLSDNVFSSPDVLKLLAKQSSLTSLNLRDSSLQNKTAMVALGAAFKSAAPPLAFLDLSGNDFEADQDCDEELYADVFSAPCLRANVVELALDDNMMESGGAVGLAKALRRYKKLQTLSLACCDITAKGAVTLAKAVGSVKAFSTLKMDGNCVSAEGVDQLGAIMQICGKTLEEMEDNDEDGEDDLDDAEDFGDDDDDDDDDGDGEEGGGAREGDIDDLDAIMQQVKIADSAGVPAA
jgi:Ran GTPase-activating protein 1